MNGMGGHHSPSAGTETWLTPPSIIEAIKRWMPRMAEHGNGTALIFARTETDSFFRYVWEQATAVLFLRSPRLHFHAGQFIQLKAPGIFA